MLDRVRRFQSNRVVVLNWSEFALCIAGGYQCDGRSHFSFKRNWSLRGLHALMALSAGLLIPFFQHYVSSHFHFGEEIYVHQRVKSSAVGV